MPYRQQLSGKTMDMSASWINKKPKPWSTPQKYGSMIDSNHGISVFVLESSDNERNLCVWTSSF